MAAGKFNNGDSFSSIRTKLNANADLIDVNTASITGKAPIASPTFTGTPAAPTATTGTNTTQIATTAFVQQEIAAISPSGAKTSGSQTLSATPAVLQYDINSCSFGGGKAYLDATTEIGKEIYVIAASNNIEVRANAANSAKMFVTFMTFVTSVTLTTNQMYRFTYIGFGTGTGGEIDGYWKAELMN